MRKQNLHVLGYSVHSRLREHHLRRLLPQRREGLFLDAGCGLGYLSEVLGDGFQRVGLDQELASLRRNRERGLGEMVRGSVSELPFRDGSFDLVLCSEVLEHLPDGVDRHTMSELARVLRPGGRLLITVPAMEGFRSSSHLRNLGHDDPEGGEYHYRQGYHWRELMRLVDPEAGLALQGRRYSMVVASELFMDLTKVVFMKKNKLAEHSQVESASGSLVFKIYRRLFPLLHACFVCEDFLLSGTLKGHIHIAAFDKVAPSPAR